jgi:hypothetical protein
MLVIGILGNKSDLIDKEEVDEREVREYAKSINAVYGRTSALNGSGIKESFDRILREFIEKRGNEKKSDSVTIKKNDKGNESNNGEKKKKCC